MAKTTISTSAIGIPTAKEIQDKVNAQRQAKLDARVKQELDEFKIELDKALENPVDDTCELTFDLLHHETIRVIEEELGYTTRPYFDMKYNTQHTIVVVFE